MDQRPSATGEMIRSSEREGATCLGQSTMARQEAQERTPMKEGRKEEHAALQGQNGKAEGSTGVQEEQIAKNEKKVGWIGLCTKRYVDVKSSLPSLAHGVFFLSSFSR